LAAVLEFLAVLAWVGVLALVSGAASAAGCAPPVPVHFAPGAGIAEVDGGLPRGARDCYVLQASLGQSLAVTQPDPADDNVVFQIYRSPWTVRRAEAGWSFAGTPLPGAEETRDTRTWTGRVPATGRYLLVIGTSRGGGTYRLRIAIQ
jgi:hypothetical protein